MILDTQAALERIDNDAELYREICEIFRDDVHDLVIKLARAVECGDMATATRQAHSLKSSAANIGASRLCTTAKAAEAALRSGDSAGIAALISKLDQDLADVMKELTKLLS